jgi:uncharacterized phage protein gp47/JayE
MPWQTPTLKEVRSTVRDHIRGSLPGADASVPNSVLRVLSDAQGGLCHLTLQYVDWLALQLLPDTAEHEWLDRHGDIWLVNSDGTVGRKQATFARGSILFTGFPGSVAPAGTILDGPNDLQYQTTKDAVLSATGGTAPAVALTAGTIGNMKAPQTLGIAVATPIVGIDLAVLGSDMVGGADTESDDQLRARVLRRIRQPPMGGAAYDYEAWALAVPGVTRAWCYPLEMGIGTVTVRFMMDDLRADNDGFPTGEDVAMVEAYINSKRPVAVKDFFVVAPIRQEIGCTVRELVPDNDSTRGAIEKSLKQMLVGYAAPGQTIFAAWKSFAIMSTPGVVSFQMPDNEDDVMLSPGHMAVLGTVVYD